MLIFDWSKNMVLWLPYFLGTKGSRVPMSYTSSRTLSIYASTTREPCAIMFFLTKRWPYYMSHKTLIVTFSIDVCVPTPMYVYYVCIYEEGDPNLFIYSFGLCYRTNIDEERSTTTFSLFYQSYPSSITLFTIHTSNHMCILSLIPFFPLYINWGFRYIHKYIHGYTHTHIYIYKEGKWGFEPCTS